MAYLIYDLNGDSIDIGFNGTSGKYIFYKLLEHIVTDYFDECSDILSENDMFSDTLLIDSESLCKLLNKLLLNDNYKSCMQSYDLTYVETIYTELHTLNQLILKLNTKSVVIYW